VAISIDSIRSVSGRNRRESCSILWTTGLLFFPSFLFGVAHASFACQR